MIRSSITKSQTTALALMLLIIIVFYTFLMRPIFDWQNNIRVQIEQTKLSNTKLLERLQKLEEELMVSPVTSDTDVFWLAQNTGEASAQIQSTINALSQETGVALKSVTPLPEQTFNQEGALGTRIEIEAPLDQFMNFLLKLELNNPPLVVEKSNIRRLVRSTNMQAQPLILGQLDIAAIIQIEGSNQ